MNFEHKVPDEKVIKINIFHYFIVAVKAVLFPPTYSGVGGGGIEAFVLSSHDDLIFIQSVIHLEVLQVPRGKTKPLTFPVWIHI